MEIDYKATKEALFATGRTVTGLCRSEGWNYGTINNFFHGNFVSDGPLYHAVVDKLKEIGVLRHKEVEQ